MVDLTTTAFALLSLTTYNNGWYYLQCSEPTSDASMMTASSCCQQAFPAHQGLFDPCVSHAVILPALEDASSTTVPRVLSFFHVSSSYTSSTDEEMKGKNRVSNTRIWRDGAWNELNDIEDTVSQWKAQLVGVGMHRDLQFHWNGDTETKRPPPPQPVVVFYLPAELFLNVEEHTDMTILHTASTIDQEEPSFASTPHGLVILLHKHHTRMDTWTLQLHARYPLPGELSDVVFPVAGDLIQWDVAAPSAADTWPVLLLTVAFALTGAVVSFGDIARVVQWV